MPVYRYQLTGIDVEDLKEQVPPADAPSISVGAIAGVVVWDVTALATSKPDLDAYFISRGWEFVATDPVDTPAESATADLNFATSIADVTKAASSAGIADTVARGDHKHDVSAAVVGTTAIADTAAEGSATSLARSDHRHAFPAGAAPPVIAAASAAGTATTAARSDHTHGGVTDIGGSAGSVSFGVAGDVSQIDVGDAAAEGASSAIARADHQHALPSPAAPVDVTKAAASAGAATTVARADHKHDVSTAVPGTILPDDAASEGAATSLARSDHKHAIAAAAAGTIAVGDAAAEGASTSFARADHTHALSAPAAPADVTKAAASAGVATTVARADHKHDVTTAAVSTIGTANAEGTATSLARSDHVHDHGAQALGGGTQHAVATTSVAGFLSAADKTKLDGVSSGAAPATLAYGANMGAGDTTKHFGAWNNGNKSATASAQNQIAVPTTGTVKSISWFSDAATATTVLKIFKNGVLAETVTLTGVEGSKATSVAVTQGDYLGVTYDSGTAPTLTNLSLTIG